MKRLAIAAALSALTALPAIAQAVDSWPRRFFDDQNTTNVGDDPKLTPGNVKFLQATASDVIRGDECPHLNGEPPPPHQANHTPIITDGLLFFGDWCGYFYVVDLQDGRKKLIRVDTGSGGGLGGAFGTYVGVQATPVVGELSTGNRRVYFGANDAEKTLWCLDLSKILAEREILRGAATPNDGTPYICPGVDEDGERVWPISLEAVQGDVEAALATVVETLPIRGNTDVLNGSPLYRKGQTIERTLADGSKATEVHDVLFSPSTGLDCSNGQFYAIDAVSGERLWIFDPVELGDGLGGTIWTVPAMNKEGALLYLTTGDCVQKPQVGEKAESLVALDPKTGEVVWHHQRRLIDALDFDIGNAPTLVDVDLNTDGDYADEGECRNIVSTDKDGCIYGFKQEKDIPEVGEKGFDPLRMDQQRVLWRTCFVPGSLGGGFNASGASYHGGVAFAAAKAVFGLAPGDDSNAFAVDACTGDFKWASSSISEGWGEGAIASGMWFQPASPGTDLQVVSADGGSDRKAELLASVKLPVAVLPGGGGPAIVDGAIYLPSSQGVVVVSLGDLNGTPASPPNPRGGDSFKGPYPLPLSPAAPALWQPVDPNDPYPLDMGLDQ